MIKEEFPRLEESIYHECISLGWSINQFNFLPPKEFKCMKRNWPSIWEWNNVNGKHILVPTTWIQNESIRRNII